MPTFLCCFRILGGELNSQYIHITYLIVDSYNMQYLANIMIYDVFSLVFFTKQYVYLVWCFSVSSLLFFFSMVKTLRILYEVKLALEEVRRDDWNINHFGVKACLESSKSNFSQRFRLRKS